MLQVLIYIVTALVSFGVLDLPLTQQRVSPPPEMREANYDSGSCVHASLVTLMRWQGQPEFAEYWRSTHSGGETWYTTARQLREGRVPFADTHGEYNVAFLEWAIRHQLGAGVAIRGGRHMVALIDLTPTHACLLDNNRVDKIYWIPRDRFLGDWRKAGSWAVTPVLFRVPRPPENF